MLTAAHPLGSIFQIAYVPTDLPAALDFWTQRMRVGPFFRLANIRMANCRYRGQPTDPDFTIYLAYWGDVQIELIEQHNDAPSIYTEWRAAGQEGVHHLCTAVDDIAAARRHCLDLGMTIAQEADYPGGGVFYADTGGGPGTMIEVMQVPEATAQRFAAMRAAAREWDGSDPVR
ncbi:VOC family protein [Sphingomonas jatrophae]|uniref:Glyoxalase/Bleomycin resistance protein/Dioxygenase superfamily protein n=1 Tax=Sphingomonas jatrophae TaxID=1166337 RepID=A0A1I6M3R7_9SPHN|nr:VOC family protein [Sphingomonas jatrophae]SFS10321.1 Glyoxalase/Bleomycin resistance protein/Dioxygenase superfamily protein [Sphingomonas jatrophae]